MQARRLREASPEVAPVGANGFQGFDDGQWDLTVRRRRAGIKDIRGGVWGPES